MNATLGQGAKVLQVVADKKVTEEQLQQILARGLFSDLLDGNIGQVDRDNFRLVLGLSPVEAIGKKKEDPKPEPPLLVFDGYVTIPATTEKFVVRDRFGKKAPVRYYLSDNFKKWFLGKVEEPTGVVKLRRHKLLRRSVDEPIIKELGGKDAVVITLAAIEWLIVSGVLAKGYWYVFYVLDDDGALRAVFVYWHDDGWYVVAFEVGRPDAWNVVHQFFSRDSSVSGV